MAKITEAIEPIIIEPIPIPKTKKIYAFCSHCEGSKIIVLTMGDQPPLEEPCPWCEATGKILFGELEG
jgi:hypothetical protein